MEDVERSVAALVAALAAAGVEAPSPPADTAILAEIDAAIAPLRLPADVRRFWELVDPPTLRIAVFPTLRSPELALQTWRAARKEYPGLEPAILFMLAYESWTYMSVELDGPHGEGGALFGWGNPDGDFTLRYARLGDWLADLARLIEEGSYEPLEYETGRWLRVLQRAGAEAKPSHPRYAGRETLPRDPLEWPEHWLRAAGLEPAAIAPQGATHTIAQVLASDPAVELRATIAGRVTAIAGIGDVANARVSDDSATIDIACPTAITALGPAVGERYEFDLSIAPGARSQPTVPASEETDDAVQSLTKAWQAKYPLAARIFATAVRPIAPGRQS
jgi:hypothetical protein